MLFLSRPTTLSFTSLCGFTVLFAAGCQAQAPNPTTTTVALAALPPKTYNQVPPPAQSPHPTQSRLGMNLNAINDWSPELPFVDVFRSARVWVSSRTGEKFGQGPTLNLDGHGWVKNLEPGCFAETPFLNLPSTQYPAGVYTCLYEGEGELNIRGVTKVLETKPGRITFELSPKDKFKTVRIVSTNPANYIRNIHVLMPSAEETYQKEPFNPLFIQRWKGFNTLRFMDWMETNNSKIKEWADRPQVEDAVWSDKGVPLEVMIDLCNRTGSNPWFCMPHEASDDYVRQFATLVKRDLKPNLKPYIEYSNEVWNTQFQQTKYAAQKGVELGLGTADKEWEAGWHYCAARSVQMFKIWEEVFGGHARFVRVMATQSVSSNVSGQKLTFQDAYKSCDALATAPYFGPMISVKNEKNPEMVADKVAEWSQDQLMDEVEQNQLPNAIKSIQKQKAIADKYGLKLVAYEGGQHIVPIRLATNNEKLTSLMVAVQRNDRMGKAYKQYLDAWREAGGDVFCVFASMSKFSKRGSFGLLEFNGDTTPKYQAVIEWNQANLQTNSKQTN